MTAANGKAAKGSGKEVLLREVDYKILSALLAHRVLTTGQVAQACEMPVRTARYRLTRLHRGAPALVTRVRRPYAEAGSAPDHWWLTAAGRRRVGDDRPIRRGDGETAGFLAHSSATAAVPLALTSHGPALGLHLTGWLRDSEAWETWTEFRKPEQKITPDGLARLVVDGEPLPVFVEVDLRSESVLRLSAKVPRYLDYANLRAWEDRHPTCPALLVLTTTQARASAVLRAAAAERKPRYFDVSHRDEMLVASCAGVYDAERAVTEPVWRTQVDGPAVTLAELLHEHMTALRIARLRRVRAAEDADPDADRWPW